MRIEGVFNKKLTNCNYILNAKILNFLSNICYVVKSLLGANVKHLIQSILTKFKIITWVPKGQKVTKKLRPSNVWGTNEGQN